mmetsp:Transcript_64012/g.73619  ORF Transcript_64012/g.73619 Transcript_64012/m.73619 type:complete len:177 (-) Transcript_64012:8-538(-)
MGWHWYLVITLFFLVFLVRYFRSGTRSGRSRIIQWHKGTDGDFETAFLRVHQNDSSIIGPVIMTILLSWTSRRQDGVIIRNKSRSKFLAIEFFGPSKLLGVPIVEIEFAISPSHKPAKTFLVGNTRIESIELDNNTIELLERHMMKCCKRNITVTDVGSGLKRLCGFLSPSLDCAN